MLGNGINSDHFGFACLYGEWDLSELEWDSFAIKLQVLVCIGRVLAFVDSLVDGHGELGIPPPSRKRAWSGVVVRKEHRGWIVVLENLSVEVQVGLGWAS